MPLNLLSAEVIGDPNLDKLTEEDIGFRKKITDAILRDVNPPKEVVKVKSAEGGN